MKKRAADILCPSVKWFDRSPSFIKRGIGPIYHLSRIGSVLQWDGARGEIRANFAFGDDLPLLGSKCENL